MTPEQIEQVLGDHESSRAAFIREANGFDWDQDVSVCSCGDVFAGAHRAHVAQVLADLMPQAMEKTVEYREVTTNDMPDGSNRFLRNERRITTSYAPVMGEWEACDE